MPIRDQDFQLEKKRADAKITQVEMASYLGVSQSQVSRYEQDPDNVPAGILRKWLQICGDMAGAQGIEMADPRVELRGRIKLMEDYAAVEPQRTDGEWAAPVVTAAQFLACVRAMAKKPRVGVFGQFDAGKSRLINVLLGGNRLPTHYQPATSIACLIRHISDKPGWQAEDVWIMDKGFNLDLADDEAHCIKHKMFAGGYDSLGQYGTHTGAGKGHEAFAATVYLESPLLTGADFLDLPGYGNSEDDKDRAEIAHKMVDVLVYTSQATGFMNQQDLTYLSVLVRNLPTLEGNDSDVAALRNLFVVATHAHHISADDGLGILNAAAARCYQHLDNAIADRAQQTGVEIGHSEFEKRFFTFSADDSAFRAAFENDLRELLAVELPKVTLKRLDTHVQLAKKDATRTCQEWITRLQVALDEREKAQREIAAIKEVEPNRLRKNAAHQQRINDLITHFENESNVFIAHSFMERASVSAIESMIKARYHDKKEAQQLAAPYLIDSLQKAVNDWTKVKANELGNEIEGFLDDYGPTISPENLANSGGNFNARVAFMSALSGFGTLGALAAWASIAAAGSNLGAYILVAQVVGRLSSLGISVGGSATVISLVSSIGGPVTLGIAAAVLVAMGVFSLFGDSWQTKMAKKIHSGLTRDEAEQKFRAGMAKFWDDTRKGFAFAVEKTEEAYQDRIRTLEALAFSTNREDIERAFNLATETRDFLAGMPWRITTG